MAEQIEYVEKKAKNFIPIDDGLRYKIIKIECASITLTVIVLVTRSAFSFYYEELHDISKATYSQPTNILLSILAFVTVGKIYFSTPFI